jgi:hypothetical protein
VNLESGVGILDVVLALKAQAARVFQNIRYHTCEHEQIQKHSRALVNAAAARQ